MHVVPSRELSKNDFGSEIAQTSEQCNSSKLPGLLLFLSEQAIKREKRLMPFLQRNLPCYIAAPCDIHYVSLHDIHLSLLRGMRPLTIAQDVPRPSAQGEVWVVSEEDQCVLVVHGTRGVRHLGHLVLSKSAAVCMERSYRSLIVLCVFFRASAVHSTREA